METKQHAPEGFPGWVTLREACFLTGLSEDDLRLEIAAGRVESSTLASRRGSGIVFLRTTDLVTAGLLGQRSAVADAPPFPISAQTAPPSVRSPMPEPRPPDRAPTDRLAPDESGAVGNTGGRSAIPARDRRPRKSRIRLVVAAAALVVEVTATALVVRRDPTTTEDTAPPVPSVATSVVWALALDDRTELAVLAIPASGTGVAVAIPATTQLDLPASGPITAGEAASSPGLAVASAQSLLRRSIQHYVFADVETLVDLVDGLGGIEVLVEESFSYAGLTMGPGPTALGGGAVRTFLESATPEDGTYRWEAVLAGLLAAPENPTAWSVPLGESDLGPAAGLVLRRARGSQVLELPTERTEIGLLPDRPAVETLAATQMEGIGEPVIRVTVLNGNGAPGLGTHVNEILAPFGFLVLISQSIGEFSESATKVLASTSELLPRAEQARDLLGVGTVYLDPHPTGISDLTIVAGGDFPGTPEA